MSIFKEVAKTVKNIFNADDDMMFEDENEFVDNNQQSNMFSLPKSFTKKNNSDGKMQNKPMPFDLSNHGFEMAKNVQTQRNRSNGKIQVYVPKTFEESFSIIKDVKSGFTAMVNVEVANPQVSTRIIDVISGAIYALDGECKKMGEKQYIFSLSTETIGAYDYLPTNGAQFNPEQGSGYGFNFVQQGFDFGNKQQGPANFPYNQGFNFNQNMNQYQNQNQQNNNFGQNAERLSQDLQSFYQPPKSQF